MKVREEQERKEALEREAKLDSFMMVSEESEVRSPRGRGDFDDSQTTKGLEEMYDDNEKVKKELFRKMEALDLAEQGRRKLRNNEIGLEEEGEGEEDERTKDSDELANDDDVDDFDFDAIIDRNDGVISRYRSDFKQIGGLLGKGGGGEVVKVQNRLDRRIYAIKKVILESEQGKLAKIGKAENAKLRREVTTISKMTHKHIVRYYQAWVEGEILPDQECRAGKQSTSNAISHKSSAVSLEENTNNTNNTSNSDSDQQSSDGFGWDKSPCLGPQTMIEAEIPSGKISDGDMSESKFSDSSHCSTSSDNNSEWSETSDVSFAHTAQNSVFADAEREFCLQSPLLGDLGIENTAYAALHEKLIGLPDTSTKNTNSSSLFEHSSLQPTKKCEHPQNYVHSNGILRNHTSPYY